MLNAQQADTWRRMRTDFEESAVSCCKLSVQLGENASPEVRRESQPAFRCPCFSSIVLKQKSWHSVPNLHSQALFTDFNLEPKSKYFFCLTVIHLWSHVFWSDLQYVELRKNTSLKFWMLVYFLKNEPKATTVLQLLTRKTCTYLSCDPLMHQMFRLYRVERNTFYLCWKC